MMSTLKIVSSGASATAPVLLSEYGAAVSYTHLTLPTSDLVEISVVPGTLKKKKQV